MKVVTMYTINELEKQLEERHDDLKSIYGMDKYRKFYFSLIYNFKNCHFPKHLEIKDFYLIDEMKKHLIRKLKIKITAIKETIELIKREESKK